MSASLWRAAFGWGLACAMYAASHVGNDDVLGVTFVLLGGYIGFISRERSAPEEAR